MLRWDICMTLQAKSHTALMGNAAITMSTLQELVWGFNLEVCSDFDQVLEYLGLMHGVG